MATSGNDGTRKRWTQDETQLYEKIVLEKPSITPSLLQKLYFKDRSINSVKCYHARYKKKLEKLNTRFNLSQSEKVKVLPEALKPNAGVHRFERIEAVEEISMSQTRDRFALSLIQSMLQSRKRRRIFNGSTDCKKHPRKLPSKSQKKHQTSQESTSQNSRNPSGKRSTIDWMVSKNLFSIGVLEKSFPSLNGKSLNKPSMNLWFKFTLRSRTKRKKMRRKKKN